MRTERQREILHLIEYHARSALVLIPEDFKSGPVISSQIVHQKAEEGAWWQVVLMLNSEHPALSDDLKREVASAMQLINEYQRLGMLNANARLMPREKKIIGEVLNAAATGPFVPDWEFRILFGLDREELTQIAREWPNADRELETVCHAINNSFCNLLYYPHRKWDRWGEFFMSSVDEVRSTYDHWKELTGR